MYKNTKVEPIHFESKSSGLDSGAELGDRSSSVSSESSEAKSIAVIGSGDFGRALSLRLAQSGYSVTIGSRNPERNR